MRNRQLHTVRLAGVTGAALLCLGALSACGPDSGGQDAPEGAKSMPTSGIPAKAWMDTRSVPLDDTLHWAPFAASGQPVPRPVAFKAMELCRTPADKDAQSLFTGWAAGRAKSGPGGEHWTAQQTLLIEGDPTHSSGLKQTVNLAEEHLTAAVKDCAKTAPNATVQVTAPGGGDAPYFAATVTVPQPDGTVVTLHEYVVVAGGTVSELSVWAGAKAGAQPKEAWTAPDGKYVATGMTAPLCEALPGC